MTNDILSQVRALKESGKLAEMKSSVLAQFALMVLEQKLPCDVKLMPGLVLHKNVPVSTLLLAINNREEFERAEAEKSPEQRLEEKQKRDEFMAQFGLSPVPAPDDVEARAERAADKIYHGADDGHLAIDYDAVVEIIMAAIKGDL